jgi:hypothetical protein
VPAVKTGATAAGEKVVLVEEMEEWAQLAFSGYKCVSLPPSQHSQTWWPAVLDRHIGRSARLHGRGRSNPFHARRVSMFQIDGVLCQKASMRRM